MIHRCLVLALFALLIGSSVTAAPVTFKDALGDFGGSVFVGDHYFTEQDTICSALCVHFSMMLRDRGTKVEIPKELLDLVDLRVSFLSTLMLSEVSSKRTFRHLDHLFYYLEVIYGGRKFLKKTYVCPDQSPALIPVLQKVKDGLAYLANSEAHSGDPSFMKGLDMRMKKAEKAINELQKNLAEYRKILDAVSK